MKKRINEGFNFLKILKKKTVKDRILKYFVETYEVSDKWSKILYDICLGYRDKDIEKKYKLANGYLRYIKYQCKMRFGLFTKYEKLSTLGLLIPIELWKDNIDELC